MSLSTEQYLAYMEELIAVPGWSLLIEDAVSQVQYLREEALDASTWEKVVEARGRAKQLAELIAIPEIIAAQRAEYEAGS